MHIMHNKTEKFVTQLHHATHGERRNTVRYAISANQIAELNKFQSQCYSKMFKVTSTRFHAAMQTFASLIDSVAVKNIKCGKIYRLAGYRPRDGDTQCHTDGPLFLKAALSCI